MAEESLKSYIGHARMVPGFGGCSRGQLVETVNLETGKSISNGVICTCKMGYEDVYVMLCCTKIKHANKSHQFRAVGGPFLLSGCHNIPRPFFMVTDDPRC